MVCSSVQYLLAESEQNFFSGQCYTVLGPVAQIHLNRTSLEAIRAAAAEISMGTALPRQQVR